MMHNVSDILMNLKLSTFMIESATTNDEYNESETIVSAVILLYARYPLTTSYNESIVE